MQTALFHHSHKKAKMFESPNISLSFHPLNVNTLSPRSAGTAAKSRRALLRRPPFA